MRKLIIVVTLVASVGLLASAALACYWDGYYVDPMGGPMMGGYYTGVAQSGPYQTSQAFRQELAAKQGEYNALMAQPNPDPQKIGQLSRKIAGLQAQFQAGAGARGFSAQGGPGSYGAPIRPYGYDSGYGGWSCW